MFCLPATLHLLDDDAEAEVGVHLGTPGFPNFPEIHPNLGLWVSLASYIHASSPKILVFFSFIGILLHELYNA